MAMGGTLTAMDDAERAFEAALYDATFQPYGQIMIMDADGGNVSQLTVTVPSPGFSGFPSWGKWSADSIRQ